ncbi:defensin-like protein 21 [Asparagus officinalis]|uniref:defensin-like protein 21 n=1 Tax=Asparagus officinalis TaxID=4686 RepID=UPI00098E26A3|nr:defensin-like protein 21 [Asparagus officinalis]
MKGASTIWLGVILLIALVPDQMRVPHAEAKVCEAPSAGFKGLCTSDTNCAQICITEGWTGGHCEGLRRRCMCQKPC